jgi:zeta-carotene desaturase
MRWKAIGWRDRLALTRLRHGGWRDIDAHATVREWLERQGQTPRVIELLWEPLAVASLNQSIDEAAGAVFGEVLRRTFTADRTDSSLGLVLRALDELYTIPSTAYIEHRGGWVKTSSLARVHVDQGPTSVRVKDEVHRPRAVICAAAWYSLPALFEGRPAALTDVIQAAESTPASPILTVNLWFDRPVTSSTFVGLPGRSMQWVFDKRALFGESASHLSLVSSGATSIVGMSNDDLTSLAAREVETSLPAARGVRPVRATVIREKQATFSLAPGQPPRPGTVTPIRNLFLAGDWTDTGLPATIEGAVVSGHLAAQAVRDAG